MTDLQQKELILLLNELKPRGIRHLAELLNMTRLNAVKLINNIKNKTLIPHDIDVTCNIIQNIIQKN